MDAPPKPVMKRKALLIAIRHVFGKAGSKFYGLSDLAFAHRDAKELRDLLIAHRGYKEEDIVLMIDDRRHPKHLWPTYQNILDQIDLLISDPPEDGHFFFYYSGHGLEEENEARARKRADGRDGDGKPILDYILHDRLITPLQNVKGSKLFALLDCCHSESLLDLQTGSEPNIYSKEWAIGAGQLFKDVAIVVTNLLKLHKTCRKERGTTLPILRRASTKWRSPPTSKTHDVRELSVICLSACRDRQLAHDDCKRELTFTKCFIDAMASKAGITWMELRDVVKDLVSDIRAKYEEMNMQESLSGSESIESFEHWSQVPRMISSSHTDLTRAVSI